EWTSAASDITCRISLMPEVTALKGTNSDAVRRAIICASVVLPVPGGPQKTIEVRRSSSIRRRRSLPLASRCSCPTNSSSVRGRIRSASGAEERSTSAPCCLLSSSGNRLAPFVLLAIREAYHHAAKILIGPIVINLVHNVFEAPVDAGLRDSLAYR